ncbi:hypothetical protein GGQ64_004346 [Rhizobium azooxidifex]|uniref:Methyltransferase domain-containing protein n=1 Tax=Mycoplana azooxidifex TaxID=1636188 RepID=A0A7W6DEE4_9HYPH|nr:hypothetical protein [Mycoplana azooxidifex]MBB3979110.1 hypothetical protein [Mycoplana azooxidifex]
MTDELIAAAKRKHDCRDGAGAHRAQHKMSTSYNRYPTIFRSSQAWAVNKYGPSMNGGALKILSFGCSDGSEVATLRAYFPSATIFGCDVDPIPYSKNVVARRAGIYFDSTPETIAENGPFDLIFAHSVLCKHPVALSIQAEFPFDQFEALVGPLHSSLIDGGLISIFNASYLFTDLGISEGYRPVRTPEIYTNGRNPKWSRSYEALTSIGAGRLSVIESDQVSSNDLRDCLFEKQPGSAIDLEWGAPEPKGAQQVAKRTYLSDRDELRESLHRDASGDYWARRHWIIVSGLNSTQALPAWWERSSPHQFSNTAPSITGLVITRDD